MTRVWRNVLISMLCVLCIPGLFWPTTVSAGRFDGFQNGTYDVATGMLTLSIRIAGIPGEQVSIDYYVFDDALQNWVHRCGWVESTDDLGNWDGERTCVHAGLTGTSKDKLELRAPAAGNKVTSQCFGSWAPEPGDGNLLQRQESELGPEFDGCQASQCAGQAVTISLKIKRGNPFQIVWVLWQAPPPPNALAWAETRETLDNQGNLDQVWAFEAQVPPPWDMGRDLLGMTTVEGVPTLDLDEQRGVWVPAGHVHGIIEHYVRYCCSGPSSSSTATWSAIKALFR